MYLKHALACRVNHAAKIILSYLVSWTCPNEMIITKALFTPVFFYVSVKRLSGESCSIQKKPCFFLAFFFFQTEIQVHGVWVRKLVSRVNGGFQHHGQSKSKRCRELDNNQRGYVENVITKLWSRNPACKKFLWYRPMLYIFLNFTGGLSGTDVIQPSTQPTTNTQGIQSIRV